MLISQSVLITFKNWLSVFNTKKFPIDFDVINDGKMKTKKKKNFFCQWNKRLGWPRNFGFQNEKKRGQKGAGHFLLPVFWVVE